MMALLIDGIGWTLLHFLWQGALIGAGAALVLASMRGAPPRQRYLVAGVSLLACLLWPAADLLIRTMSALSDSAETTLMYSLGTRDTGKPRHAAADVAVASMPYLVAAWAFGVLVLAARGGAALAWIARSASAPLAPAYQRRAAELARRFGIARPVSVHLLERLDSPVTAGWRHPLILLPAPLADSLPPTQVDALLAHELAHIRRHDYLANLLQTMIETLLFFHPAVWWLARRIRAERELVADAMAAGLLGDARALAQALAALERHRHGAMALAQAANGGELLARVRALVKPDAVRVQLRKVVPAIALAIGGVAVAAHAAGSAAGELLTRRAVADFSSCNKPIWPAAALAAEHTGRVTLQFRIARDGTVADGKVARSSGYTSLDQAALEGISRCRFKPAQLNGMPVASTVNMQYAWVLE